MSRRRLTEQEIFDLLMESDVESPSENEENLNENVEQTLEDIVIDTRVKSFEENDEDWEDLETEPDFEPSEARVIATAQEGEDVIINEDVIVELFDQAERESITITNKSDIKWRRREFVARSIPPFEINSEELDETEVKTPYEYFSHYFSNELFDSFAFFTNLYAQQKNVKRFKPTDKNEIKKLFGLHILIGCMKFSRLRLYWDPILGIQAFKSNMTCDRFTQLRNNLHIVNNLEISKDNSDKFVKVRPVINAVRNRCLQLPVEEVVSIDEQIIPYTGKLSTKQYMKGKPNPWGIKVYVLAGKTGQPYDFIVYQGSTSGLSADCQRKYGFGAAVVIKLVERLHEPGHKIFFDNFFTTFQLLEYLRHKNHIAIGTVRINRFNNPPLVTDKELSNKGRGSYDQVVSRDGAIVLVKWQDNKSIHLGSNFVGAGIADVVKRWNKKTKKYDQISRPEIVRLYNDGMGGVDSLDQFIAYYRVFIKSRKWTLRLITHFLDFALAASWVEYRRYAEKMGQPKNTILDLLHFRLQVSNALLYSGQQLYPSKRGRPSNSRECSPSSPVATKRDMEVRPVPDVRFDEISHFPIHDGKKEATRCKMNCQTSSQGTAGRTHFVCRKCNVHLCITKERSCFEQFHKK